MVLSIRGLPFEVPRYSLTGDILSFQRCSLQYRYYSGSALPPSRPVQMWTGEFVHGVLEEAYRQWLANHPAFPWPSNQTPYPPPATPLSRLPHDIGTLGDLVESKLIAAGKQPRSSEARDSAYRRVTAAINLLGPYLFPLITAAEHRISGTRPMPQLPGGASPGRGDRYELTGVVDVISSINAQTDNTNPLVKIIQSIAVSAGPDFDLIVDYKGARRPATDDPHWHHEQWQIQTYSWLCGQAPNARPIGAGLLIYINELEPSRTDLEEYRRDISRGVADVVPKPGSQDYYAIHRWQPGPGVPMPQFSTAFKIARAIRVIDVSSGEVANALSQIDQVVLQIEQSAQNENNSGNIPNNWTACGEERDCVACDFRHFCPNPAHRRNNPQATIQPPVAPG